MASVNAQNSIRFFMDYCSEGSYRLDETKELVTMLAFLNAGIEEQKALIETLDLASLKTLKHTLACYSKSSSLSLKERGEVNLFAEVVQAATNKITQRLYTLSPSL